ncbi:MAG: hypothetical protein EU530_09935 [Promethearchaeota archaeon]|nr:MAG: hypothetical protein EU530_09935 [Candidatus Lokiarchaeota archaeon]
MRKPKQKTKRGYPIGVIVGFEPMGAVIWKIFSERPQLAERVKLGRKFKNAELNQLYRFYEDLIHALRPLLNAGLRSILLLSPPKTTYAAGFLDHIKHHHRWLLRENNPHSATFRQLVGSGTTEDELSLFMQSEEYREAVGSATSAEADQLIYQMEARLNDVDSGLVLFSLKDIEQLVFAEGTRKKKFKPLKLLPEHILLTADYLKTSQQKSRIQRLLQIAKNRDIKTKIIIDDESPSGMRVTQLGGIVCFLRTNSEYEKQLAEQLFQ